MHFDEITDDAVVLELGGRVAAHRLARNLTQGEFAQLAGVGRSTVQRIERGESIQLSSFVKLLRALDRLDGLDALLSATVRSPLADLERERGRRQRARRSGGTGTPRGQRLGRPARPPVPDPEGDSPVDAPWVWGDEDGA